MTEFEGLYTAVVKSGPKDIERNLTKIPGIHQQEALDSALEKAVSLALDPKVQNIKYLLKLGADPNGSSGNEGTVLNYAYSAGLDHIVELLLQAGADVNAPYSNVLENAVNKKDTAYVVRFVEAGADINDKSKLLYVDDLLSTSDSEIQKYLISKGINSATDALKKRLEDVPVLSMADFDYPDPGYQPNKMRQVQHMPKATEIDVFALEQETVPKPELLIDPSEQLQIQNYSSKFFIVRGNTKAHQELLRKHSGRFIPKLKGWLIPLSRRELVEEAVAQLSNVPSQITPNIPELITESPDLPTESPEYTPTESPEDSITPDDTDFLIKNLVAENSINRPTVVNNETINLYTPVGKYGFMTVSFTRPTLFYLDNHYWDSIERYLMYKVYEGTYKAKVIREEATLDEARRKFNVTTVPTAKTPKQLVINQKLRPLANSVISNKYLQHREKFFYRANKAKFLQNNIFRHKLLNTGDQEIVNKNSHDIFGYEGNLLGNTLMKLRDEFGGSAYNQRDVTKTNSLIIERYPGNKNFYVIRGDPEPDLAAEIRHIGTYRTKNGKVIRGKLNLNLQGGAGWLIPYSKHREAKKLVFSTYPNEKKIEVSGRNWVKNRMKKFVEVAILFSRFRGRPEVGPDDVLFSIKDVFGGEDFLNSDDEQPADHFTKSVWAYVDKHEAAIADSAVQLLWNFLSKMVLEFTQGIETFDQMKDLINKIEADTLDTSIKAVEGLTERESIVIDSFNRLFRLLKKISDNESKNCVTVIHMMLGKKHYEHIREIYSKKTSMQGESEYPDEETQYRRRFKIKNPHIQPVLDNLPTDISKKCKLLVLTTLDYVMDLEGDDVIDISKRLIILSQKGKQPSPTPKTPFSEVSDIPKLPTVDNSVDVVEESQNPETPPFDGTPDPNIPEDPDTPEDPGTPEDPNTPDFA